MPIQADLRQVIYALSDALDLVGVDDIAHGKRVGVMAAECAKAMNWSQDEVLFIFDLGILHDIGVSSTAAHHHLTHQFEWTGSPAYTRFGHDLLKDFCPLARMALPILYHHTRWDVMVREGVSPQVAIPANLILLMDRVDALMAQHYTSGKILQQRDSTRHEITIRKGSYFSPRLVDAFLQISAHESFWLRMEPRALAGYMNDMAALGTPYAATPAELQQLAEIFARIVDAKSPFTFTHSRGVAQVAARLGQLLGLAPEQCEKLQIAGLLHDLGKLRVPDEILDKPAGLDQNERLLMNAHSFETKQILRNIDGFEDIQLWAGSHHEEPGGLGYPDGIDAAQLPIEARILRVADIFQAMVQDRPYRQGLSLEAAGLFMHELQKSGRIDAAVGQALQAHLPELLAAARLEDSATAEAA
ncbi:MAG: HD domain-containing protein [Rhodoferax sp.]|nr:HD domain-containing protein [Rhodoferax sp.]